MKKIFFLLAIVFLANSSNVFALVKDNEITEELVEPSNPGLSGRGSEIAYLTDKVNDLERRLNDMDRDRRFTQDRLRQLDRDVNDIKRRF